VAISDLTSVSLDWITPSAEFVMAKHARVSTVDPEREEYEKLLRYCIKHSHWSVFEQASASFEIITSRAVSQQILRHRSFSFQELSARYSNPSEILEDYADRCWQFELRAQDLKNRQNSIKYEDSDIEELFRARIGRLFLEIDTLYHDMLEAGVAKECARNILPMATPTKLHMNGTVRSWLFYVGLRSAPGTQAEHKFVSDSIGLALVELLPTVCRAVMAEAAAETNPGLLGWNYLGQN
jgi:thymidylate synthase (FAD)